MMALADVVKNRDALIARMSATTADALFSVNLRRFRSPDGTLALHSSVHLLLCLHDAARTHATHHTRTTARAHTSHTTHDRTGRREILRSSKAYALPGHVARHVDLISGLTDFPPIRTVSHLFPSFHQHFCILYLFNLFNFVFI
jgi:hypothetical protein